MFAHGGLLAEHAALGLDALNAASAAWFAGVKGPDAPMPAFLAGSRAVVWSRHYGQPEAGRNDCGALAAALAATGAARVVVGHTIQAPAGINAACDGRAIRIDVGMSVGCGDAPVQVLELLDDGREAYTLRYAADGRAAVREPVAPASGAPATPPREPLEEEAAQPRKRTKA